MSFGRLGDGELTCSRHAAAGCAASLPSPQPGQCLLVRQARPGIADPSATPMRPRDVIPASRRTREARWRAPLQIQTLAHFSIGRRDATVLRKSHHHPPPSPSHPLRTLALFERRCRRCEEVALDVFVCRGSRDRRRCVILGPNGTSRGPGAAPRRELAHLHNSRRKQTERQLDAQRLASHPSLTLPLGQLSSTTVPLHHHHHTITAHSLLATTFAHLEIAAFTDLAALP